MNLLIILIFNNGNGTKYARFWIEVDKINVSHSTEGNKFISSLVTLDNIKMKVLQGKWFLKMENLLIQKIKTQIVLTLSLQAN